MSPLKTERLTEDDTEVLSDMIGKYCDSAELSPRAQALVNKLMRAEAIEVQSRPKWEIDEHTVLDKSFVVRGPGGLILNVDYDDVDHAEVDVRIEEMVTILNEHYVPF